MNKHLLLSLNILVFLACNKGTTLPTYTVPASANITVTSFNHTEDTVNVGDTIYLTAAGTIFDTLYIYGYYSISSTAPGSPVYSVGSSSSPIRVPAVLQSGNVNGLNSWTATIALTNLTTTANTKLKITGNFIYQLSLSSQGTNTALSIADAGQTNKTIFVQ
jgi:hypothetical protein